MRGPRPIPVVPLVSEPWSTVANGTWQVVYSSAWSHLMAEVITPTAPSGRGSAWPSTGGCSQAVELVRLGSGVWGWRQDAGIQACRWNTDHSLSSRRGWFPFSYTRVLDSDGSDRLHMR